MNPKQTPPSDPNTPPAGTPTAPTDNPPAGGDGAPTATDQPGTDAAGDAPPWGDDFDPARAWQTIQNQRKSEAEKARKLADAEAKLAEIEREKMTEAERVAADLEAARNEAAALREAAVSAKFEAAAVAAGIPPERMAAARALAGDVATSDESGNITIDTSAFDRLKAEHDYLFAQAAPRQNVSFGAAAGQGQGGQAGALDPVQLEFAKRAGMTPEQFAAYTKRTER